MQHVVVFEAPRDRDLVCFLLRVANTQFTGGLLADLLAYVDRADSAYVVLAFAEDGTLPAAELAEYVALAQRSGARIVERTPEELLTRALRGELAFYSGVPTPSAIEALFEESKQCNQPN